MIRKIEIGEKCKDVLELVFGKGDIMFHGIQFPDEPDKFSLWIYRDACPKKLAKRLPSL